MVAAKKATTLTLMYKKAQRRDDHLTSILAHPSVNKGDAFFCFVLCYFFEMSSYNHHCKDIEMGDKKMTSLHLRVRFSTRSDAFLKTKRSKMHNIF